MTTGSDRVKVRTAEVNLWLCCDLTEDSPEDCDDFVALVEVGWDSQAEERTAEASSSRCYDLTEGLPEDCDDFVALAEVGWDSFHSCTLAYFPS